MQILVGAIYMQEYYKASEERSCPEELWFHVLANWVSFEGWSMVRPTHHFAQSRDQTTQLHQCPHTFQYAHVRKPDFLDVLQLRVLW